MVPFFKRSVASIILIATVVSAFNLLNPDLAGAASPLIVIDAGHGGIQAGAIGPNGLAEKTVNLRVALRLRSYLQAAGARVLMTRTTDKTLSLAARAAIANRAGATRFVSIHHNASANRSVNGTETYIRRGADSSSLDMANKIQRSLLKYLGLSNRGVHGAGFYVLRNTRMPAVLTEASFISNSAEANLLRTSSYIDKEARAIFFGLKAHMKFKPSYNPLAISGAAAPAKDIYFPHVADTSGFWRSLASVKNTATASRIITVSFYTDNGISRGTKKVILTPEQTFNFHPRKKLGANFTGSIKISSSGSDLVGKITQVSQSNQAMASAQGLTPSTELYVPALVDSDNWSSFLAVMNTSDSLSAVTVRYFGKDGGLVRTIGPFNLISKAKRYLKPMESIGAPFDGSATITSTEPVVAYVSRVNPAKTRLGLAGAVEKTDKLYFAKAPDNTNWLSFLSVQNTGDAAKQVNIYAYRPGKMTIKKTLTIAKNARYTARVANITGSGFIGSLKIVGPDNSLAAFLSQVNRNASSLGVIEGQQGLPKLYFPGVSDSTYWSSEVTAKNIGGSKIKVNIKFFTEAGKRTVFKSPELKANGSYSFYPFELANQGFNGSVNIGDPDGQLAGYLAQYR